MRFQRTALTLVAAFGIAGLAQAQSKEIKIAHVTDMTGILQAYAKQTSVGLQLGLEYATGGKMEVAGKKITVLTKDNQGKADVSKTLLEAAYRDDKVDLAIGPTNSAAALAMLPVARDFKKVLIVDAAAAEYITGDKGNRYIFRTGRNSDHDGYANAVVFGRPGNFIATLAPDYAFGKEGVASFRDALKQTPAKLVYEEFPPLTTTDFTAPATRIFHRLKDQPGRKFLWILWAGTGNTFKILDMNPERYGIEIVTGGMPLALMPAYKKLIGMEGATHYYFQFPRNAANDWLVKEHKKRFNAPPDFFTVTGMITGMAVVEALKKTKGDTGTEKLISTLEGMAFDSPKGKVYFNKDSHQLMQPMYHFKMINDPEMKDGVGMSLVREIRIEEMKFPAKKLQ